MSKRGKVAYACIWVVCEWVGVSASWCAFKEGDNQKQQRERERNGSAHEMGNGECLYCIPTPAPGVSNLPNWPFLAQTGNLNPNEAIIGDPGSPQGEQRGITLLPQKEKKREDKQRSSVTPSRLQVTPTSWVLKHWENKEKESSHRPETDTGWKIGLTQTHTSHTCHSLGIEKTLHCTLWFRERFPTRHTGWTEVRAKPLDILQSISKKLYSRLPCTPVTSQNPSRSLNSMVKPQHIGTTPHNVLSNPTGETQ